MRNTLLYVLIIVLCITCTSKKRTEYSILNLVPKNTPLVIKVNDFETLTTELADNEILHELESLKSLSLIASKIKPLQYITDQKKGLLALSALDSLSFDFTYITNDSLVFKDWDKLSKKSIETLPYKSSYIVRFEVEDSHFYSISIDDHTVLSSSQRLLQNLIDSDGNENINTSLSDFYSISNSEKILNIYIDLAKGEFLINQLFPSEQHISNFASWISLDLSLHDSELILNGVAKPNTTKPHFLNLFNNTNPIPNNTSTLLPSNVNYYKSFGLNDFQKYSENKSFINSTTTPLDSILNAVEEIGIADLNNEKILLLRTYGTATLLDYINEEKVGTEEYNGNEIWELNSNLKIFESIEPLIGESNFKYSTVIENTLLFSKTKNALESVLAQYKIGNTYNVSTIYKNAETILTSSSSILTISNLNGAVDMLRESVSENLGNDLETTNLSDFVFSSQLIADDGFYHANFLIKKINDISESSTISSAFEVQFNTDLATVPQFVTNHNNRRKEIIVQDRENILYLISNSGKIIWQKQLEGTIQGKIQQIDLFKNGKLQLAFTTNNEFLILDRNGKEVEPFIKKYTGGNLNPLAVFDYDNNKNYRFIVTQNEKVFMYNSKGDIVKGFTYNTAEATIVDAPQHFRIGKKDYLIFKLQNGLLKITNRVGKTRVNVKDKFSFSDNEIKLHQNKFTFTSLEGLLFQIDTKGKITSSNLNLAKDHGMDATSKTLAIMNDNVLRIRDRKVLLDLGVYSKPSIFYLNDKIYISVTDIQNQKIYLFDSQAEPISGFPIFGSSAIDMADMDNNKRPDIVLKNQENTIKVFKTR